MTCPSCRRKLITVVQSVRLLGAKAAAKRKLLACPSCQHVVRLMRMPREYEVPDRRERLTLRAVMREKKV